jgi:hypothetical protein
MQRAGSQYGATSYPAQQQQYAYPNGQYYQQQPQPMQHQYSGQQQQYVSTPYVGNVPFPQPSPYSAPPPLQAAPSQPPSVRHVPRAQTPHPRTRRHTNSGASKHGRARPLRPAIKNVDRTRSTSANVSNSLTVPILRTRSHSGTAENRPRTSTISRTRTNSGVRADPGMHPYTFITTFFSSLQLVKITFSCR